MLFGTGRERQILPRIVRAGRLTQDCRSPGEYLSYFLSHMTGFPEAEKYVYIQ